MEVFMKHIYLERGKTFLICLSISFFFLMICTKSSFLYPMNTWTDANCFFTIGKAALDGKVYYLDLFDQKGPLLYFYHTIAAMISYDSFLGVFLIEVLSFSFFLYYAFKLLTLYLKKTTTYYLLPIISFLILTLPAFSHGDSAEEFCLPFLMYSLYSMIKFFKSNESTPSYQMIFINGIMAGLVFTIKYSMLGFWFAFMMSFFFLMIKVKQYKKAIISCFVFLFGMLLPFIPWLLYFLSHHALQTFYDAYIHFNLFLYPSTTPLILRLFMVITKPIKFFATNLGIGIPFVFGCIYLWFTPIILNKRTHKWILCSTFFFLCFSVFFGGISFRYYPLILTPFLLFGMIGIALLIEEKYISIYSKNWDAGLIIMTTICLGFSYYASSNTPMMYPKTTKEDLVQYQFAEIINQKKNPTLLNYHFLDGGFYLTTNTIPTTKYFQKQNIPDTVFPDIKEEQDRLIKEKKVDFVITRTKIDRYESFEYPEELKKNYREVDRKNETYEEKRFRYVLWQKK